MKNNELKVFLAGFGRFEENSGISDRPVLAGSGVKKKKRQV